MAQPIALKWDDFFNGRIVPIERNRTVRRAARLAAATHLAMMPTAAFAATVDNSVTWINLLTTVMGVADWLCVGVIIFAGTIWMFNNRTKALDMLLCGSSGYIIIRHAIDIRNWLRTL